MGQGPVETRNNRAASLVFLRFDPRGGILAPSERSLQVGLSSANDLRFDGLLREDAETERLSLRWRGGVQRGEWTLEVPFLSRGGGFMDPLIDGYHNLLGIHNLRDDVSYGHSEIDLPGSGRFGSASGIGDVVGAFSRPMGPQAFWTFGIKLPTGNAAQLLGSGGVDVGASFYARWKLGPRFTLFGQAGVVAQGPAPKLAHERGLIDQESLALEWRPNSRDGWVLQWQSEPSAIRTGLKFSDGPHRMLTVGYNRRIDASDSLQAFFSEDGDFLNYKAPELVNVAPDFTIGVRWTRRF